MAQRTDQQRKSIEVYCRELAEALNDAGWEMKKFFQHSNEVEIPWSQELVKNALWKPVQQAMLEKISTTQLDKMEVDKVYRVLDRHISSNFGISVEFPNEN